jgi:hypothetical protein
MSDLIVVVTALGLVGCGPALKTGGDFTPKRVRALMFADVCGLQHYFDSNAPVLRPRADQSISASPDKPTPAAGRKGQLAWGTATFILAKKRVQDAFAALVRRLYKRVPDIGSAEKTAPPISVTVRYHMRSGRRTMPIGAETVVERSKTSVEIPYHPCVGAFFFGREYYQIRGRLGGQQ